MLHKIDKRFIEMTETEREQYQKNQGIPPSGCTNPDVIEFFKNQGNRGEIRLQLAIGQTELTIAEIEKLQKLAKKCKFALTIFEDLA